MFYIYGHKLFFAHNLFCVTFTLFWPIVTSHFPLRQLGVAIDPRKTKTKEQEVSCKQGGTI
jgi:hypothetical protein